MSEHSSDSESSVSWSYLTASTDDDEFSTSKLRAQDLNRGVSAQRNLKNARSTLSIYAEKLLDKDGVPIVFGVRSAMLKDATPFGRRVTQFYELQRERKTQQGWEWSCVYRSPDGVAVDRNGYVVFGEMSTTEQQLNNMQPDRKLRLAFYKRHLKRQHELISYITTSVTELTKSMLQKELAIKLEGSSGDDDGLGNVIVNPVEKMDDGTLHIHLRADHFLRKRFISSLDDQSAWGKLRQWPSLRSLH